jgi:predicted AlkP superfamily phosphohydrolase/phosphomutase
MKRISISLHLLCLKYLIIIAVQYVLIYQEIFDIFIHVFVGLDRINKSYWLSVNQHHIRDD